MYRVRSPRRSENKSRPSSPKQKTAKLLSVKQVKDVIHEVYASFTKKQQGPRGFKLTMSRHYSEHMKQKYGLKSLRREMSLAFLESLEEHAHDHTVATFGAIMRNELEDGFRHVERNTRNGVKQSLRNMYISQEPLAREEDLDRRIKAKEAGDLLVSV